MLTSFFPVARERSPNWRWLGDDEQGQPLENGGRPQTTAGDGALLAARHRLPEAGRPVEKRRSRHWTAPAMDIVTLVATPEEAVEALRKSL